MSHWQDSRSVNKRHEHTPVTGSDGRSICTGCRMVIVKPILSSDDPRLVNAGLMRSPHHREDDPVDEQMTLPELLIALHDVGPDYGYRRAPVAPYILLVMGQS